MSISRQVSILNAALYRANQLASGMKTALSSVSDTDMSKVLTQLNDMQRVIAAQIDLTTQQNEAQVKQAEMALKIAKASGDQKAIASAQTALDAAQKKRNADIIAGKERELEILKKILAEKKNLAGVNVSTDEQVDILAIEKKISAREHEITLIKQKQELEAIESKKSAFDSELDAALSKVTAIKEQFAQQKKLLALKMELAKANNDEAAQSRVQAEIKELELKQAKATTLAHQEELSALQKLMSARQAQISPTGDTPANVLAEVAALNKTIQLKQQEIAQSEIQEQIERANHSNAMRRHAEMLERREAANASLQQQSAAIAAATQQQVAAIKTESAAIPPLVAHYQNLNARRSAQIEMEQRVVAAMQQRMAQGEALSSQELAELSRRQSLIADMQRQNELAQIQINHQMRLHSATQQYIAVAGAGTEPLITGARRVSQENDLVRQGVDSITGAVERLASTSQARTPSITSDAARISEAFTATGDSVRATESAVGSLGTRSSTTATSISSMNNVDLANAIRNVSALDSAIASLKTKVDEAINAFKRLDSALD